LPIGEIVPNQFSDAGLANVITGDRVAGGRQLLRWQQLAALVLVGATWPLWFLEGGYPAVALFAQLRDVPRLVDGLLAVALVVCLVAGLMWPRTAWVAGQFGCWLALFALNQHRLQPWAWQFALLSGLWLVAGLLASGGRESAVGSASHGRPERDSAGSETREGSELPKDSCRTQAEAWTPTNATLAATLWLQAARALVISIYVWSAVSKLDYGFATVTGAWLEQGLARAIPGWTALPAAVRSGVPWLLPVGELAVALLLISRRTRAWGLVSSILMHLGLWLTLGPWGLRHESPVLIWNVYFIWQNWLLFRPASSEPQPVVARMSPAARRGWVSVLTLVCGYPALYPLGLIDAWPAWAVYAHSPSRIEVTLDAPVSTEIVEGQLSATEGWWLRHQRWLPLASVAGPVPEGESPERYRLRLDRWSLDVLGVPVYPSAGFQQQVLRAVLEQAPDLEGELLVIPQAQSGSGLRLARRAGFRRVERQGPARFRR
jgi:hypothetical protein